jgi:hypothetical protein
MFAIQFACTESAKAETLPLISDIYHIRHPCQDSTIIPTLEGYAMSDGKPRQTAGEAIRSRVMVSHALCAIAESELHAGEMTMAAGTISSARILIQEINALVGPGMSGGAADELAEFLRELDHRLRNIDTAIRLYE